MPEFWDAITDLWPLVIGQPAILALFTVCVWQGSWVTDGDEQPRENRGDI